jgi:hypothetical protein
MYTPSSSVTAPAACPLACGSLLFEYHLRVSGQSNATLMLSMMCERENSV